MSSRKILGYQVVSSLVYLTHPRALIEIYSPSWREWWKEWVLPIVVLLSLIFQFLLGILGRLRKHNKMLLVRVLVWSAYITADSIATFALGILLNNLTEIHDDPNTRLLDENTQLTAFWAPLLLFHLGGPDNITAYAMEDNELWSRHLFGLVFYAGMTLVVMLMAWTGSYLSVLSIIMFIPGLIKYGERTWVLWSASKSKRRESTLKEGILESSLQHLPKHSHVSEEQKLVAGLQLINLCKHHMVDATVDVSNGKVFTNRLPEDAFKVIEIELGLMFDLLYTKAQLLYTRWGLVLRLFTFVLTCSVLVLFSVHVGAHSNKYSTANVCITLLLIIIEVMLGMYSALLLLFSDRFLIWLIEHRKTSTFRTLQSYSLLKSPRWSNNMSQCNLLSFNTHKAKCNFFQVTDNVRELIFQYIKQKAKEQATTRQVSFAALPFRGGFEKWIVIFHIATEVLYRLDKDPQDPHPRRKLIKRISRYMMHLLKEHPAMLLAKNSWINFKSISDATSCYTNLIPDISKVEACKTMCKRFTDTAFQDRNFTNRLLKEAVKLVQEMDAQEMEDKWKRIEIFWFEMLGYAARRSKVDEHAQMLRRGGEFLTQVWLLLAHFGLTENYPIERDD